MNPGKRDQRVAFQSLTTTDDGQGGQSDPVWTTQFSRWCQVKFLRGNERLMAQQLESPRDYRVICPRDSQTATVTTSWRLLWRGKALNIRTIADEGPRPQDMMLECESGVAT